MDKQENKHITYDHLGNKFKSVRAMCKHYGIDESTYFRKKQKGWSVEQCLTRQRVKRMSVTAPDGTVYNSEMDICNIYNVNIATFRKRRANGYTIEECLGLIPLLHEGLHDLVVDDNLCIITSFLYESNMIYFHCVKNEEETIMTRDEILIYYRKHVLESG